MSTTKEIAVRPTNEQVIAWGEAAGEQPIETWLAGLADEAALAAGPRSWPVTITLEHPVELGSQRITVLEVREGCLGDLKGIRVDGGGIAMDQLMLLASRLCGQPLKVIEKLKGRGGAEALSMARDFFTECLTGGKRRSPP